VDLAAWEKPKINRCHTISSRKAAFSLLHSLYTTHPQLIPQVITGYYSTLLGQVRNPIRLATRRSYTSVATTSWACATLATSAT